MIFWLPSRHSSSVISPRDVLRNRADASFWVRIMRPRNVVSISLENSPSNHFGSSDLNFSLVCAVVIQLCNQAPWAVAELFLDPSVPVMNVIHWTSSSSTGLLCCRRMALRSLASVQLRGDALFIFSFLRPWHHAPILQTICRPRFSYPAGYPWRLYCAPRKILSPKMLVR